MAIGYPNGRVSTVSRQHIYYIVIYDGHTWEIEGDYDDFHEATKVQRDLRALGFEVITEVVSVERPYMIDVIMANLRSKALARAGLGYQP